VESEYLFQPMRSKTSPTPDGAGRGFSAGLGVGYLGLKKEIFRVCASRLSHQTKETHHEKTKAKESDPH
jgi:hypothetical protein